MPDFSSEKWKDSLGEHWMLLPEGVKKDLGFRPAPKDWKFPESNIVFLQLIKLCKQAKFAQICELVTKSEVEKIYTDYLAVFGAYAASEIGRDNLVKNFLDSIKDVDSETRKYLERLIFPEPSLSNFEKKQMDDKGSCSTSGDGSRRNDYSKVERENNMFLGTISELVDLYGAHMPRSAEVGAEVTIFCAIYSEDPFRHSLIKDHFHNVMSLGPKVTPLYIFENNDSPDPDVFPYSIVVDKALTIYQSWALACELANTKYVMNLNLDDRLYRNSISVLLSEFNKPNVAIVGGDWLVRFGSKPSSDASTRDSRSIRTTTFAPAWPPVRSGQPLRLGSGTGERGTLGPATVWKKSLLNQIFYPNKFGNGQLIRSIGDSAWWRLISQMELGDRARVPLIVGEYLSNPGAQAEFRVTDEQKVLREHGVLIERRAK